MNLLEKQVKMMRSIFKIQSKEIIRLRNYARKLENEKEYLLFRNNDLKNSRELGDNCESTRNSRERL